MATPFIGEMVGFGGNFAPVNWAMAQGQTLSISQNTALFSILGTTYGGNGQTTFQLPNLNGRAAIGQGTLQGGQTYTLGQVGGTENATLTTGNLPAHIHTQTGSATKATLQTPSAGSFVGKTQDSTGTAIPQVYVPAGSEGTVVPMGATGITGQSLPFSIRSPYLTITWLIATQGIFPSRN